MSPNVLNLSISLPEVFPHPTTLPASSTVGMLITHSLVAFKMLKVRLRLLTTQPTMGGSKSIIVCHDMVMTLAFPFRAVVSSTTGPGSSRRYTSESGSVLRGKAGMLQFIPPAYVENCAKSRSCRFSCSNQYAVHGTAFSR